MGGLSSCCSVEKSSNECGDVAGFDVGETRDLEISMNTAEDNLQEMSQSNSFCQGNRTLSCKVDGHRVMPLMQESNQFNDSTNEFSQRRHVEFNQHHQSTSFGKSRGSQLLQSEDGIKAKVVLENGKRLSCTVHFDPDNEEIVVATPGKLRQIPVAEIKKVLQTKKQLKRIKSKANLSEEPQCIALQLTARYRSIPLAFAQEEDKKYFLEVVEEEKHRMNEKSKRRIT